MIPLDWCITVDWFAGTGKGTASFLLAKHLGYSCLDTWAMYRVIALALLRAWYAVDDTAGIVSFLPTIPFRPQKDDHGGFVRYLGAEDVSSHIRMPEVSAIVSQVSKIPEVRSLLIRYQQELWSQGWLVADGRDMGSVVFPEAQVKFLFRCDSLIRAQRRQKQLGEQGIFQSLEDIEANIIMRDELDQHHIDALIRRFGDDVVTIDTWLLSPEQVLATMLDHVRSRASVR